MGGGGGGTQVVDQSREEREMGEGDIDGMQINDKRHILNFFSLKRLRVLTQFLKVERYFYKEVLKVENFEHLRILLKQNTNGFLIKVTIRIFFKLFKNFKRILKKKI